MPEHQQIQQSKKPDTIVQKQTTTLSLTHVSNPFSIIQRARLNPKSLTPADVLQLQRTVGNRAVGRLLSGIGNTSTAQQATVQRQEIPEEEKPLQGKMKQTIQRQEIPDEEEPLQGKMVGTFQRQEIPEKEELLQGKMAETIQWQEIPEEEEPLQTKRENNTGMPDNLKAGVESLSGIDMNDVGVHYNSDKPAEVGALAYTKGTDIHVAPGQERHLSHEAWHVVQQMKERVKPTMQMKDGIMVNNDEGLEHEADVMGAKAMKMRRLERSEFEFPISRMPHGIRLPSIQRQPVAQSSTLQERDNFKKSIKVELADDLKTIAMAYFYWSYKFRYQTTVDTYIDGELDKLIKTYGLKNQDIIRLQIKRRAGYLKAGSVGLLALLDTVRDELPETMQTEGNVQNLKIVLFELSSQGQTTEETLETLDAEKVAVRWSSLKRNLKLVETRLKSDWPSLQRKFKIRGTLKLIHLTGSDFHNEGQSVSIAESVLGEKVVYKPRSLSPDMTLTGESNSVFAKLNKYGTSERIHLPTTRYDQRADEKGEYGYMEFLKPASVLSDEEASNYYFTMGQIAVAVKLLGVTDLHQENILAGRGAPFLIDAETSFLPYVMLADSFKSTGLAASLKAFIKGDEQTPNAFLTKSEEEELAKLKTTRPATNDLDFMIKKRRAVLENKSPLSTYFIQGVLNMLAFIGKNRDKLINYLIKRATQVEHVRLVPLPTVEFNMFIRGFHFPENDIKEIIEVACSKVGDNLEKSGFDLLPAFGETVRKGLTQDFQRRDVPLFHYEPKHEGVFYCGKEIAATKKDQTLPNAIHKTVSRLTMTSVEEVLSSYVKP